MSALSRPRTQVIEAAIELGRRWCEGKIIDGSPALGHALKVARKVDEHFPAAAPDLIAAVIVHDAPFFAPDDIDLESVLTMMLSSDVARIVRAIEAEHDALDNSPAPQVDTANTDVLIASAADKVVSIGAIMKRARRFRDPAVFWLTREAFLLRIPYFQAFAVTAGPYLPPSLATDLNRVVTIAADATAPYRRIASVD
jgi:hypothetical protein